MRAITGLAIISTRKSRAPVRWARPAARAALAAAVSHSSRRPLRRAEADEREDDRVSALVGLAGEEGELQRDLGEGGLPVFPDRAQEDPPRLLWPRARRRPGGAADRGERRWRPGWPAVHTAAGLPGRQRPGQDEQGHGRRRHQAAPQVVEDLPARDEGQAVAGEARAAGDPGEQPAQDLPVAAHPAVLAPGVDEDARRVVVHDLHVRDERGARVEALEEVVRQEGVLGHAPLEGGHERVHVVEPLAGEDPLPEQVLVGVRHRGGVGVDSGVAGVEAGEERARGARHGHADAGLQDPVALGDAAEAGVEARPVQRMGDDADQLLRGVAGQAGVGVEGEAVAHAGKDLDVAHLHGEARVRGPAQHRVPLLELAALALPAHPDVSRRGSTAARGGRGRSGRRAPRRTARSAPRSPPGPPPGSPRPRASRARGRPRSRSGSRSGCAGRGCRGPAPRCARRGSLTPATLVSSVGTTTIVRAFSGTPAEKSRRGRRRGGAHRAASRCTKAMATSLAGQQEEERGRRPPPRPARLPPLEVGDAEAEEEGGEERDRARDRRAVAWREGEAPYPPPETGTIGDVGLEVAAALADQVVADVGGAIPGLPRSPRPGARSRRRAGRLAAAPRRWARTAPPPPGGSGRGSGSPCPRRPPPDRAAARARPG